MRKLKLQEEGIKQDYYRCPSSQSLLAERQ